MTEEHECKWEVQAAFGGEVVAYCIHRCNEERDEKWIAGRLNATERLKAIKAQLYSEHIVEEPPFLVDECAADLKAYADILEGKDEEN